MKMTLSQRLIGSFAIIVLIMVASGVYSYVKAIEMHDDLEVLSTLNETMEAVQIVKFLSMQQYQIQADLIINQDMSIFSEFEAVDISRPF